MGSHNNIGEIMDRARDEIMQQVNNDRARSAKAIADLQKQARGLTLDSTPGKNVVCVIDASSTPFAARLLALGSNGGATAARKILKLLKDSDCFDDEPIAPDVFAFIDTHSMMNITDEVNIRNFIAGFNQFDCNMFMVDIGNDENARIAHVESRIRKASTSSETWKIVLGGCDKDIYLPLLEELVNSAKDDMLVILRTSTPSARLKRLELSTIRVNDGLFEAGSIPASAAASDAAGGRGGSPSLGIMPSPPTSPIWSRSRSLAQLSEGWRNRTRSDSGPLRLDPTLPPWENKPPPCNVFYLLGNCKKESCFCSHEYILTDEDKERMRKGSKNRACDSLKGGYQCTFGERCLFGHQCPYGLSCKHLLEGQCWFGDEKYHFDE